jgi:hypothetical protein
MVPFFPPLRKRRCLVAIFLLLVLGLWVGYWATYRAAVFLFNATSQPCVQIKENSVTTKPKLRMLKQTFNLYPDGDAHSKVVGVGLSRYVSGHIPAVFLVFEDNSGQPISVNLPGNEDKLAEDEFFYKTWSEGALWCEILARHAVVEIVDKPKIESGHVEVPTARLVDDKFREPTKQERARYCP